ncbi:TniQ family protein [Ornithinimicrobium ciconiae]|uniref:TniQ family protein n=1 Tax=Ornithinimicrobium ciconiae TaxID=2594265 RepID=UPI0013FD04D7|nr:TniQ family protein [Ornithinimicrobium ciconiae]
MSVLPVRITPRPGQALDSYLEHLASANQLTTAQLMALVSTVSGAPTRYLALAPDPALLATVAHLAHLNPVDLARTVLTSLPGVGDLDPGTRYGHRDLAAKGWVQLHGTQACPACLADHGAWSTTWRLPVMTTCTTHRRHLAVTCPGCRRPFRDGRSTQLRPVGADTTCGNPLGAGPRQQCTRDLTTIPTAVASPAQLHRQARTDTALTGRPVTVLGQQSEPAAYLADLRHLTVLLLHLATQDTTGHLADWTPSLQTETAARTSRRGPRWGIRPPTDPGLRAQALTTADQILNRPDRESGADQLSPWLAAIPTGTDSRLGWLADRTVMTPTLTGLLTAALAPYRRISHSLTAQTGGPMTNPRYIPQVLPLATYQEHLAADLTVTPLLGRTYITLCLARTTPGVTTWAHAAQTLHLTGEMGTRTARTCSARLTVDNPTFIDHLLQLGATLDTDVDYRTLEDHVRQCWANRDWPSDWPGADATGTKQANLITWAWTHLAHAHPDTSPAWGRQGRTRPGWQAYTRFEKTLTRQQQQTLTEEFAKAAAAR